MYNRLHIAIIASIIFFICFVSASETSAPVVRLSFTQQSIAAAAVSQPESTTTVAAVEESRVHVQEFTPVNETLSIGEFTVAWLGPSIVDLSKYVTLSSAAYCLSYSAKVAKIQDWTCGPCLDSGLSLTDVSTFDISGYDIGMFIGYSADDNVIYVSYRGSSNVENWIADLTFAKESFPGCTSCNVHTGFQKAYLQTRPSLLSTIQALLVKYPGAQVSITGHSLGAAVTVFAAVDLKEGIYGTEVFDLQLPIVNFGQPRVGDQAFVDYFETVFGTQGFIRVTHRADIVPRVPPENFGFKHFVREDWFYDNQLDHTICSSSIGDDKSCNTGELIPLITDHLTYLEYTMSKPSYQC